jgi:hypothetical protein
MMTGLLRIWLEGHFQDQTLIEDLKLQNKLWRPGLTTGIVINSVTDWEPGLVEHHPALIIKRNAWRHQRLGINDQAMAGFPNISGDKTFANLWQGSHTIFCISSVGGELEVLAAEVFRELNEFGPVFRQYTGLMRFAVAEVGELAILEEGRQNYVVPITVAYTVQEFWLIRQEAPKVNRIDLAKF